MPGIGIQGPPGPPGTPGPIGQPGKITVNVPLIGLAVYMNVFQQSDLRSILCMHINL